MSGDWKPVAGRDKIPMFYVPELGKTFAQVEPEVKNRLSHRAEAARKVVQRLRREVETVPAS